MSVQKTIYLLILLIVSVTSVSMIGTAEARNSKNKPLEVQLQSCSLEAKDSERLACFDDLAKTNADETDSVSNEPDSLPMDLGGGKFDKNKKELLANKGQLASCKKSHDGRWIFYFESGQVWKQVAIDNVKRRYKGCKYKVAIKKDGFGYKMHIDELSRKIRIKRLR